MADPELTENQEALIKVSREAEEHKKDFKASQANADIGIKGASEEAGKKKAAMMAAFKELGEKAVAQFQKSPPQNPAIVNTPPKETLPAGLTKVGPTSSQPDLRKAA